MKYIKIKAVKDYCHKHDKRISVMALEVMDRHIEKKLEWVCQSKFKTITEKDL